MGQISLPQATSPARCRRPRTIALAIHGLLLGAAAATAMLPAAAVHAQEAEGRHYEIPAGPLTEVLKRFGVESGQMLSFSTELTAGRHSPGVHGRHTVAAALRSLLATTGLEAVPRDGGYVLRRPPAPLGKDSQLAPVVITAAVDRGASTEGSGSYTAASATAGDKAGSALREIPRSISILTRQQLEDQRLTTLDDAVAQLPGVTLVPGSTGYMASQYHTRGFQITNISVDGSPTAWQSYDTTSNTGLAKYDNIQLLRGPDALFSGNGQPSGSINLVRKRPLDTFQLKTALSAGRWNNYLGEVDITGPLIDSGHIRGRLVAAHNDREYFFDGAHRRLTTFYGIVEADLAERTLLSFGASHDRDEGSGRETPPNFPRYADGHPLPIPRSQGYTGWSFKDSEATNVFTTLEHHFNDDWKGRFNASHSESSLQTNVSSHYGVVDPATGLGSYLFGGTWAEGEFRNTSVDANLVGSFDLLGRRHRVIVGADYRNARYDVPLYYSIATQAWITDWTRLDPDELLPINGRGAKDWIMSASTKQHGIYANGKFQIHGPFSVVLGGRHASYEAGSASGYADATRPSVTTNSSNDTFTPYYALTYDFSPQWTSFFTVAESFEDQSNYYTADHKPLDPTSGRSYELGIKGELMGGRLNTSLTLYSAKRDNYAVRISTDSSFDTPGRTCCYAGNGQFSSRGLELDISGALTPDWQVNAGYTYDDNKSEYGSADGQRYASYTPKQILRLWTSYHLGAAAAGWKVGGGVQAQSGFFRSGTINTWNAATGKYDGPLTAYDFTEPGRAIWNAFAEYRIDKQWTAALNIYNLFDKHYLQTVGTTNSGNYYGTPRSFALTLRGSF